jgi:hypothetical protein
MEIYEKIEIYREFENMLLSSSDVFLKEANQGPERQTNGYYFNDVSIHISHSEISFYRALKFAEMDDCPEGHDLIGIADDGEYYVNDEVPISEIFEMMPDDIREYMIYNMDKF